MTQRAISFEADLDISDVTRGLNRIEQQARRAGSTVGRVGGGLGRAGGGIGRTVGAGAGIGAGLAVFELAFEKIFELFEGTPILETFVMALDSIFKAAGPLVGILLDTLTPIIKALAPAIEPLARALAPLIELLGAGLLIVIQAITPAIILFAQGLEKVTTFIRDVVLSAFRFIVDQLNKLPFIDIQVELDKTGDSFGAMAVQVADAGKMSDDAAPKVEATGDAIEEAGKQAGKKGQGRATDQFLALVDGIRATTEATGGLSRLELRLANERAFNAAAADRAATITALWTRVADENAMATRRLTDEMDEAYTANDRLGVIIGGSRGPAVDLANAIDAMTTQITEAQTAADLNQAAFDALSPAMMAAAIELGIFRGKIEEVATTAGTALTSVTSAASRANQFVRDATTIDSIAGAFDHDAIGRVRGAGGRGEFSPQVREALRQAQELVNESGGTIPLQATAERILSMLTVNVQVGDETVDAVTETSDHRRELTGR